MLSQWAKNTSSNDTEKVDAVAKTADKDETEGVRSKYKGVSWIRKRKIFLAQVRQGGKDYHIGYYKNEIDAAKAYDVKAKERFGSDAVTNFGPDGTFNPDAKKTRQDRQNRPKRSAKSGGTKSHKKKARKTKAMSKDSEFKSKYKGVHFDKHRKKYRAMLCIDGKHVYAGYYTDETEAARAFDTEARNRFGSNAVTNFKSDGSFDPKAKSTRQKRANKKSDDAPVAAVVLEAVPVKAGKTKASSKRAKE
eukprot:g2082.t1